MYTHTHIHTLTYTHLHTHSHTHMPTHIHMPSNSHPRKYSQRCICAHIDTTKTHIHTHTHMLYSIHSCTHTLHRHAQRYPTHTSSHTLLNKQALTHTHSHRQSCMQPCKLICTLTHTHTLTADPDRRRTDFRYTGPTISTLLFSPGPMDLDTLYVIQMCRGGYGVRSMKMWSDICSSQKMSQGQ